MSKIVRAPFTSEQVVNLNNYQQAGFFHPYTCGTDTCRCDLIAEEAGWRCPECGYTQDWCLEAIADGLFKQLQEALNGTETQ